MPRGAPQQRRQAPFLLPAPAWLRAWWTRSDASALNQDFLLWTGYKSSQLTLMFLAPQHLTCPQWPKSFSPLTTLSEILLISFLHPCLNLPIWPQWLQAAQVSWGSMGDRDVPQAAAGWVQATAPEARFKLHWQSASVVQSKQRAVLSLQD